MKCLSVDPPSTSFQATCAVLSAQHACSAVPVLFFISAQIRAGVFLFAPFRAASTHAKPTKSAISPVFSIVLNWHRNCYLPDKVNKRDNSSFESDLIFAMYV